MEKITDTTYKTIKELILKSDWGKEIQVRELLKYLYDEVEEFANSCIKKDIDNIYEEAADVIMMLLYAVIKEADNQEVNPIEYILENIDIKLRRRYSVFFEGNTEADEEKYWKETKKIEKVIVQYLFCQNELFNIYQKANRGHMRYNNAVHCMNCGYIDNLGKENLLLWQHGRRRYIFDILKKNYNNYILGAKFAEDDYFANETGDCFRIIKYIVKYPDSGKVISDLLVENQDCDRFINFLMKPLRNHIVNYAWTGKKLLLEERARLEKIIEKSKNHLKDMPEGSLRLSKSKSYVQYYYCTDENKRGTYISKENRNLIQQLAQKAYDEKILRLAEKRWKQIDKLVQDYEEDEIEQIFYKEHPKRQHFIKTVEPIWEEKIAEWKNQEYR